MQEGGQSKYTSNCAFAAKRPRVQGRCAPDWVQVLSFVNIQKISVNLLP
jgi:hypothetical protein